MNVYVLHQVHSNKIYCTPGPLLVHACMYALKLAKEANWLMLSSFVLYYVCVYI